MLYVLLGLNSVQESIRKTATSELSTLLGADVSINKLKVVPFSRIELSNVSIALPKDTIISASNLNAGISFSNLFRGRIVVTDVELMQPNINLSCDSVGAPLNVQPMLDRLKGNENNPPLSFNLAVHTVVLRSGAIEFNIKSEPQRQGFDPNHIAISDLRADLTAPRISNKDTKINLKRLNFTEKSGLTIKNLRGNLSITDSIISLNGLSLSMPESLLGFGNINLNTLDSHKITDIEIIRGSSIDFADIAPLVPQLKKISGKININGLASIYRDSISLNHFNINLPEQHFFAKTNAEATFDNAFAHKLDLGLNGMAMAKTINAFQPLNKQHRSIIENLGNVNFSGKASWTKPNNVSVTGLLTSAIGNIDLDAHLHANKLQGIVEANELNLSKLLPDQGLGHANLSATFNLSPQKGKAAISIDRIHWLKHTYNDIEANLEYAGTKYAALVNIADSLATASAHISIDTAPGALLANLSASIDNFKPYELGIWNKYETYALQGDITGIFEGETWYRPVGQLNIENLRFTDPNNTGLIEEPIILSTDLSGPDGIIELNSDLIDFTANGEINLSTISNTINNILAQSLPEYFAEKPTTSSEPNDFSFAATVHDDAPLFKFVKTPAKLLYPISINGHINQIEQEATAIINIPYLQQDNNLISKTAISAYLADECSLKAHSKMPSKFGDMELDLLTTLNNNVGHAHFTLNDPKIDNYSADINISFEPTHSGAEISIEPSSLRFGEGDLAWAIDPSTINFDKEKIVINEFNVKRPGQSLNINGTASAEQNDLLTVKLDNINLDEIFAALKLSQALQFGGNASGTITGEGILSSEPILQTDNLFVKDMKYGHSIMGDAKINAKWNNDIRGIELLADVEGQTEKSLIKVDGVISPATQLIDITFDAQHAPLGFIHNFTNTWASHVGGHASGKVRLFGDLKYVDLEGDVNAEDFAITIGFTNVTYYANDSVHFRPGKIIVNGNPVHDASGRTAKLSGQLNHRYFIEADFKFMVTELNNILAYNVAPNIDGFLYGKVRANNGAITITGVPNKVTIEGDVTTGPDSDFVCELSNNQSTQEFDFLTFNDVTPKETIDTLALHPGSPELDKLMQDRVNKLTVAPMLSNFECNMQIGITPDIKMTLVMDPVSGDKITGYGNGHVGILYNSNTDQVQLYGDYRIDKGDYNFSLQDIILKNFTIKDGSTVSFQGDPSNAVLDISAIYQLNANLTDLDESFKTDKELQRTNVPVNAVLNVAGSIQDPQISFDLDFPTLTTDIKRKVTSIVNTDEIMNRQIIYLLALNRFYTPEYMAATKGNELMSLASGTISSQLSNILGQLSDKISVSPSLRSNSEDFSDVEFDVALSSTLLNNRLLLNGNFGYRDKAMNTSRTQFVGDLDVEYLLTRKGNWRLKAYNHFNDRNLYVKTALTTQGLGVVFKHDFDCLFKRKRPSEHTDSTAVQAPK